ncbi:MAG: hypothetical protein JW787_17705 [Sedimentisphaerales bacterium]|nr:hypothetical protein [Sedimentisphaerales bacterium]
MIGSDTDKTAVLDGFVISGGSDHSIAYSDSPFGGGGLYIYSGSPTILNCTFKENIVYGSGAGLLIVNGSNPIIENCIFTKNVSLDGGALTYWEDCNSILVNCVFNDNYAEGLGGGLYSKKNNLQLIKCIFNFNKCNRSGGGICNTKSTLAITDCNFIENTGGSGGGIYNEDNCNLVLSNCVILKNISSYSGGGMCNSDVNNIFITNCIFNNNTAMRSSGAISNWSKKTTIINCLFTGNIVYGLHPYISEAGGLYVRGDTTLSNCTFFGNWAEQYQSILKFSSSLLKLNNCILWDGENSISPGSPSSVEIKYSDIKGGFEGIGNINVDPMFANPGYWSDANDPNIIVEPNEPNAVWIEGDYHLKSQAGRFDPNTQSWVQDDVTSPCIDAGDPNWPIGYESFPNGGRINMGTYGGTSEASQSYFGKPVCETIVAGDINGDCRVDILDLEIMMLHWLEEH